MEWLNLKMQLNCSPSDSRKNKTSNLLRIYFMEIIGGRGLMERDLREVIGI